MSENTTNLQIIAQPVLISLTTLDTTLAVLCFGSRAVGTADAHSDIDLLIICEPTIPPAAIRGQAYARLPALANLRLHHETPGWETPWAPEVDTLEQANIRYELHYNTKEWVVQVVRRITCEGALSIPEMPFRPYTFLGLLATSVILYDPQQVAQAIIAATQPYPVRLRTNVLNEFVPRMDEGVQELYDCAARGIGNSAFLFHLVRVSDALSSVLFAINETYDPATKRTEQALASLPRLPSHFLERYRRLLEGPFTEEKRREIVAQLALLVSEVKALQSQ